MFQSRRGHPSYARYERSVRSEERDRRTSFGTAKENHGFRYTQTRKSPDGNESRAYICLHESEKTSKNESPEGLIRGFEVLIIGEGYTFDEHNKKNVSSLLVKSVLPTVWGSRKAAFFAI